MCQHELRSGTGCVESPDVEDTVVVAVIGKAKVVECTMGQRDGLKLGLRI